MTSVKDEIWKPVKGYEGLYEVSNFGRVKSLERVVNSHPANCKRTLPEKIRTGHVSKKLGYAMITLSANNVNKSVYIHRLVAEAFIPNPNNLPMINHKDEDKTNNSIDNLEWCTAKYNMAYSNVFACAKTRNSKPVRQYDYDGNLIKEYASSNEAGRAMGVRPYCISFCCRGKIGSVKGFLWKYADENYVKKQHVRARDRRIVQMDMEGNVLKIWPSQKDAAVGTRSLATAIGSCCNGRRKSANGYKWEYYDKTPIVF
jgi:hypothetical protein